MSEPSSLNRSLSLPLVTLYGLGVTIGAGIYVLIGAATARAGVHAPLSFVFAAVVMGFSAWSFAEFAARYPVSAGEAAYVRAGFNSNWLSLAAGLMVMSAGLIASAAITVGSIGYIRAIAPAPWLPDAGLIIAVIGVLGLIAAWGIRESVLFVAVFTVIEVSALVVIIVAGFWVKPELVFALPELVPSFDSTTPWIAISSAGLLAFFAFIGFEDIVNLAEEVDAPEQTLPRAIVLTLVLSTILYFLVAAVAVLAVPLDLLAQSSAPLSLVFQHLTGASATIITAIAIFATLNGVIIQIIMASRVLYGLARQGSVPAVFGLVHAKTRTPLVATAIIVGASLLLALFFPLQFLAEMASRLILLVFLAVNLALLRLKQRDGPPPRGTICVPRAVPVLGAAACIVFLTIDLWR